MGGVYGGAPYEVENFRVSKEYFVAALCGGGGASEGAVAYYQGTGGRHLRKTHMSFRPRPGGVEGAGEHTKVGLTLSNNPKP